MSWSSEGSNGPAADITDVRNDKSATIQDKDPVYRPLPNGSLPDSTTCLPSSSVTLPNITLNFTPPASLLSTLDEGKLLESNSGASPLLTESLNRNEVVSENGGTNSEIQNIMGQFDKDDVNHVGTNDSSPRLSLQVPLLDASINHPPRKSSLEPLQYASDFPINTSLSSRRLSSATKISQIPEHRPADVVIDSHPRLDRGTTSHLRSDDYSIIPPTGPDTTPSHSLLTPEPNAEPDLTFDFHRFLEQLRHRTADPVAKFLRSFLVEFGKKKWMAHEQGKIISDFLAFISNKMAVCDVWRTLSDIEFDNAKEGMEKLVMNRLYSQTFSPAIPSAAPTSSAKSKKNTLDRLLERGRTGQHQEDTERDEILSQKVRIYGWVREEHLDILPVNDGGLRFLALAQKELLKINSYRAPRDKIICVLNCCKVIFGLLRNSKASDTSADSFVPILIYVVLHANPDHLVSNVHYILRFRNKEKLMGEAGYYLSSLMGAIQFIENLDRTTLTISASEFESNVERAVSAIAERHRAEIPSHERPWGTKMPASSEAEMVAHNLAHPDDSAEKVLDSGIAMTGLLRTMQKPLTSMGRIFSDGKSASYDSLKGNRPVQHSRLDSLSSTGLSPVVFQPPRNIYDEQRTPDGTRDTADNITTQGAKLSENDTRIVQNSSEMAQVQQSQRDEHHDVVDTLVNMFPGLDEELIEDVVRIKQGRVQLAVDACLALSS